MEQQDTGALQGAGRSEEEEGDSLQWQRVAQLVGGKYDRIDPVQALPLLPLQVNSVAVAGLTTSPRRAHCTDSLSCFTDSVLTNT